MSAVIWSGARWTLWTVFTTFLVANTVVLTKAALSQLRPDSGVALPVMGEEVGLAVRMGIVAILAIASWFIAQVLYKMLARGDEAKKIRGISPQDAVNPAMSLLSYLVLLACAFAFLGAGSWYWLPVLFLIVLLWSVLSIWSMVGLGPMLAAMILAVGAAALVVLS